MDDQRGQTAATNGLNQPFDFWLWHAQPRPRPFVETFFDPAGQPQPFQFFAFDIGGTYHEDGECVIRAGDG